MTCNGDLLALHPYGYTPFTVDLTPVLKEETNLSISTCGGLYREASLFIGGELLGFGSGNPCTEENYTHERNVFGGYALACLRAGRGPGEIKLTVRGAGLPDATVTVQCK